jgi:hypothetical protein
MCAELDIEGNMYMVQYGCLVANAAHSWRAVYLQSDFYERNQIAMDVILRGVSCDVLKPSSPVGVAVVAPSKRGDFAMEGEEPISLVVAEKSVSQGNDSAESSGIFLEDPIVVGRVPDSVIIESDEHRPGPSGSPSGGASDSLGGGNDDDELSPDLLRKMKSERDHPLLVEDDFDILCTVFGKRELQEILDMSSSEEDTSDVLFSVPEFRAGIS